MRSRLLDVGVKVEVREENEERESVEDGAVLHPQRELARDGDAVHGLHETQSELALRRSRSNIQGNTHFTLHMAKLQA